MQIEEKKSLKLVCSHCGHSWNYKGKNSIYATCPDCLGKTKVKKEE